MLVVLWNIPTRSILYIDYMISDRLRKYKLHAKFILNHCWMKFTQIPRLFANLVISMDVSLILWTTKLSEADSVMMAWKLILLITIKVNYYNFAHLQDNYRGLAISQLFFKHEPKLKTAYILDYKGAQLWPLVDCCWLTYHRAIERIIKLIQAERKLLKWTTRGIKAN